MRRLRFAFALLLVGGAGGCSYVKITDGQGQQTGFTYYDPVPCLLVKRRADTRDIVEASVQVLPNRAKAHHVRMQPGLGNTTFKIHTENGVLKQFKQTSDGKPIESIEKLSAAFKSIANELLVQEKAKIATEQQYKPAAETANALRSLAVGVERVEKAIADEAVDPTLFEVAPPGCPPLTLEDVRLQLRRFVACILECGTPQTCRVEELQRSLRNLNLMCMSLPEKVSLRARTLERPEKEVQKDAMAVELSAEVCKAIQAAIVLLTAYCTPLPTSTETGITYELYEIVVSVDGTCRLEPLSLSCILDLVAAKGGTSCLSPPPPGG